MSAPAPSAHWRAPPSGWLGPPDNTQTPRTRRHSLSPEPPAGGPACAAALSLCRIVYEKLCCSSVWICCGRPTPAARRAPARRRTSGRCAGAGWSGRWSTPTGCGGFLARGPRWQGWPGDLGGTLRRPSEPWAPASSWYRPLWARSSKVSHAGHPLWRASDPLGWGPCAYGCRSCSLLLTAPDGHDGFPVPLIQSAGRRKREDNKEG